MRLRTLPIRPLRKNLILQLWRTWITQRRQLVHRFTPVIIRHERYLQYIIIQVQDVHTVPNNNLYQRHAILIERMLYVLINKQNRKTYSTTWHLNVYLSRVAVGNTQVIFRRRITRIFVIVWTDFMDVLKNCKKKFWLTEKLPYFVRNM